MLAVCLVVLHESVECNMSVYDRPFSIHRVPRTNLMLMVVDARCCGLRDDPPPVVSLQPEQVDHILSFVRPSVYLSVRLNSYGTCIGVSGQTIL